MSENTIASDRDAPIDDWGGLVDRMNRLLRLRTTPIGMKRFRTREEMEAIPRIRRPQAIHTTDQIVGQAARNGWTVGITMEDLVNHMNDTTSSELVRQDYFGGSAVFHVK